MGLAQTVESVFAENGALAAELSGYTPRTEQQTMARAVADAIEGEQTLIVEAGTGTGKTLAYLIPAMLAGQRVIISTGTRTLQDQLYHRDLPIAQAALPHPVRSALLKGRANYLCLYRMQRTLDSGRLESRELADGLQRLSAWSGATRTGDLAEAPEGSVDSRLLSRVTSTADNCLGQECPLYSECFLMEARRQAQEADVVVINHHLLLADWALRDGGFGEVLPSADVYVLDEAHQLPETAARFFGVTVSSRQLHDLARDTRLEQQREAGDAVFLTELSGQLERAIAELRLAFGDGARAAWQAFPVVVTEAADTLAHALSELAVALGTQASRGRGLESCQRRASDLASTLRGFLSHTDDEAQVSWAETRGQGFALRRTPLDIADAMAASRERYGQSWVLTSATLTVNGQFGHFLQRLGLSDAQTLALESPFDYAHNALFYRPPNLPAPNEPGFDQAYLVAVEAVLRASGGRAFLLFTSHRALQRAAEHLRASHWPNVLVQGEASQLQLLTAFRATGNAILLGTQSFWEGVDVRGPALSCVMIDRLPFASPADPVLQARVAWLKGQGQNAFTDYQLPEAVISLRQGMGRLIRDFDDRGVLVLGDPRVQSKSYGRIFLHSLPAMPHTQSIAEVEAFFDQSSTMS